MAASSLRRFFCSLIAAIIFSFLAASSIFRLSSDVVAVTGVDTGSSLLVRLSSGEGSTGFALATSARPSCFGVADDF